MHAHKPDIQISYRRSAVGVLLGALLLAAPARAGEHPRLLISPSDIPHLRHACGLSTPGADSQGMGESGRRAADYQALRMRLATEFGGIALPGEVAASAFLHLVDPDDPHDARRLKLITDALTGPSAFGPDPLELALALDWCWYDLDPDARHEFILAARERARLFDPSVSPLDHRGFRAALATLAVALAVDERDDPAPSWAGARGRILTAARRYFATTFPTFADWRGGVPTGPSRAAHEESDAALAIELASLLTGEDRWATYRDSVGRWLEHYVMATVPHPALQHQFLRDGGSDAPLTPAARWDEMLPLTAHLIARRTGDAAAATVARRVEDRLASLDDAGAVLWRWVPIVLDVGAVPGCDMGRLPAARNLDGAVVLRGESGPQTAAIWIDTGQPYLHSGQHFDAGHFLIHAGGHLAVEGGDDIALEAIAAKGGRQRLGDEQETVSFEQYAASSIAHNCMIFWDAARVPRWRGRRYHPSGGQTPMDGACRDFVASLDDQRRKPARLLAYGQHETDAYVALDLGAAYDARSVGRYTREFILLRGRVLLIVDRAELAGARIIPTWVLNIPAAPTVAGRPLTPDARVRGDSADAGVWEVDGTGWIRWTEHSGSLACASLLPDKRVVRIVGGPAERQVVPKGLHRGRSYVGGSPGGFERLVLPSGRPGALNAWYELAEPALLGPQFAAQPHWGRIEIEPTARRVDQLFVTMLVIGSADERTPALPQSVREGDELLVSLMLDDRKVNVRLPAADILGGKVLSNDSQDGDWVLPTQIETDPPLSVR